MKTHRYNLFPFPPLFTVAEVYLNQSVNAYVVLLEIAKFCIENYFHSHRHICECILKVFNIKLSIYWVIANMVCEKWHASILILP